MVESRVAALSRLFIASSVPCQDPQFAHPLNLLILLSCLAQAGEATTAGKRLPEVVERVPSVLVPEEKQNDQDEEACEGHR